MLNDAVGPTPLTHAVLGLAAAEALRVERPAKMRLRMLAVTCATVPDLDALGFAFGIRYGDLLGHRGLSHSLLFAVLLGTLAAAVGFTGTGPRPRRFPILAVYFVALVASHGLLDAMTNGGLGIAFFSPFDPSRHFLPWRPIVVAPLSIGGLLSERGGRMLASEIAVVWAPALVGLALVVGLRRVREARERLANTVTSHGEEAREDASREAHSDPSP